MITRVWVPFWTESVNPPNQTLFPLIFGTKWQFCPGYITIYNLSTARKIAVGFVFGVFTALLVEEEAFTFLLGHLILASKGGNVCLKILCDVPFSNLMVIIIFNTLILEIPLH